MARYSGGKPIKVGAHRPRLIARLEGRIKDGPIPEEGVRLAWDQIVAGAVRLKAVVGAAALDAARLLELEDASEGLVTRARNNSPLLQDAQV